MRRIIITLLLICAYTYTYAQQLTVKSVNLRVGDTRAKINSRQDTNGNACAIVRVGVVGVDNLVFPDAVGKVDYSLNEYVVYVPDGLKALQYANKAGQKLGRIVFDDYDLEINSNLSYNIIFDSESHLRSAVFTIQPKNAQLTFDGEKIKLDNNGVAMINKPIGKYVYKIVADGYETQSDTILLVEDEISTITDVILEQKLYPVYINVFPENASVFIDNAPYSKSALSSLRLPGGKHTVRAIASDYEGEEKTIDVKPNGTSFNLKLEKAKQEVVKHKEERTRTRVNIRNATYFTGRFSFAGISKLSAIFDSRNALDFGLEFSGIQHFGGILGVREAISFFMLKPNKNEYYFEKSIYNDSTRWMSHIDIPLQLGVSIPFGPYNRHLFSAFAGGYGEYLWIQDGIEESALTDEEKKSMTDSEDSNYWDYGIRVSAILDIGHFTIGADFSQSLNKMGFSAGISIGAKFYRKKKR